ncbi:MAG: hypothetical protein JWQ04_1386 [Pedosphaera sp.]|nr:hypothetical protein [Pedosphaera sp.]
MLPDCICQHQAVEITDDHIIVKLPEISKTVDFHSN